MPSESLIRLPDEMLGGIPKERHETVALMPFDVFILSKFFALGGAGRH